MYSIGPIIIYYTIKINPKSWYNNIRGDNLKELIKRINELANKSKSLGLNEEEKEEQNKLRQKYIQNFRGNFKETLMNVKVVDQMGNNVTPEKLLKEQNKKKN